MSDFSDFHALARVATQRFHVNVSAMIYARDTATASGVIRYKLAAKGRMLPADGVDAVEDSPEKAVEALVKTLKCAKQQYEQRLNAPRQVASYTEEQLEQLRKAY